MIKLQRWVLIFGLSMSSAFASAPSLNIYHWSGYLPEAILQQFTQETGIRVYSSSYDSNEVLYTKLKAMPSHGYDVIMPSSYAIDRMRQEGMLMPLNKTKLTRTSSIHSKWLDQAYDPSNQYSVPYLFSATGLVVNTHYYNPKELTHWDALWQPHFKNKLLMLDDVRELFSVALLVLGFSPNTQHPHEIHQAYEKLRTLFKNIRVFNSEGSADLYATEELNIGMGWSGDSYRAHNLNPDIQFIYPKEGHIVSIDSLAIPKGAQHVAEAHQFIDFLLRPDIAAKISLLTGYGTTQQDALSHLPEEIRSNKTIYPDEETFKRGIVQLSAGPHTKLYEKYWERLKIED